MDTFIKVHAGVVQSCGKVVIVLVELYTSDPFSNKCNAQVLTRTLHWIY